MQYWARTILRGNSNHYQVSLQVQLSCLLPYDLNVLRRPDRALFVLHGHILDLQAGIDVEGCHFQQNSCKSQAALKTAINIVLDIVEAHKTRTVSRTAPSFPYLVRAALEQLYRQTEWEEVGWLQSAEERLRTLLDQIAQHSEGDIL